MEISIVHLFLYHSMKEKATKGLFITHEDLIKVLRSRVYRMPNYLYRIIIKEMMKLELIKKIGNTNNLHYELISKNAERQLSKYDFFP